MFGSFGHLVCEVVQRGRQRVQKHSSEDELDIDGVNFHDLVYTGTHTHTHAHTPKGQ